MSASRGERRRHERAQQKQPVIIAGDGVVAATLGDRYEAKPHAELPEKVPGVHRWVATAAWVVSDAVVEGASDPDLMKFLDHENLMYLAIGCWDCEKPLGEIQHGSHCSGDAS